jgi:hypothetical protein
MNIVEVETKGKRIIIRNRFGVSVMEMSGQN